MATTNDLLLLLAVMAEQSGEPVSEMRIEMVARRLEPLGIDAVCQALEKLVDSSRRFPTVAEVKAAMGLTDISDEDRAREVGERIYAGIARFGSLLPGSASAARRWQEIEAFLGPIGTEVVRMQGGWNALCELATNANAPTLKSQWRELAGVLVRKAKAGDLETPPSFAAALPAAVRHEIKALEAKFTPFPPARRRTEEEQ